MTEEQLKVKKLERAGE